MADHRISPAVKYSVQHTVMEDTRYWASVQTYRMYMRRET